MTPPTSTATKPKYRDAYAGVFDRGYGKECLYVPLDYDFHSSGTLLPAEISAHIVDTVNVYQTIKLFLVTDQATTALLYKTSQQNISRWIDRNKKVNSLIQSGTKVADIKKSDL